VRRSAVLGLVSATTVVLGFSACQDSLSPRMEGELSPAPTRSASQTEAPGLGQVTPGRYIVVFTDDVQNPRVETERMAGTLPGRPIAIYEHAVKGFAIENLPEQAANGLRQDPRVSFVEPDRVVGLAEQTTPTGISRSFAAANPALDIDGTDDVRVDVDVAIIDTGIDFEHPDLNVVGGTDCSNLSGGGPPWSRTATCGPGGDDDHYHGTHVGGTVGALDNGIGVVGIAPGARLWAVKVLNSSGSAYTSNVVAGIDWVAANAGQIEVANMSLGGSGFSQAEYDAIQGAVNAGVAFAVAAGNSDADANGYSPAAFDNVLTVSALADFDGAPGGNGSPTCRSDQDDTLADFSNWGSAVDIAAPGVCILSTFPLEQGSYGTISGTSMASPHAAGALALLASVDNPNSAADVAGLYGDVRAAGNFDWTDESGDGEKEPLLDVATFGAATVAGQGGGGAITDNPPSVTISSPSDGASFSSGSSISFVGSASDDLDGNLTSSLVWTSDSGDPLGTGGSFDAVLQDGPHTITASVTDSGGHTSRVDISITVEQAPSGGGIALSVAAYKVRGVQHADLSWTGAGSSEVDIRRDGDLTVTTDNDGAYTDSTGGKGGGMATYQVCEAGSATACSNTVTVTW
jgi:subtilisin